MRERDEDGALGVADTELTLETADDILRFLILACGEELGDDGDLFVL